MSLFAEVIIPIPIKDTFTFSVPEEMNEVIRPGHRVEVQFGPKKKYTGIVYRLHQDAPSALKAKPILSILDDEPIIDEKQFELWNKVAEYYVSTLGEVMNTALPAGIRAHSETSYVYKEPDEESVEALEGDEALIAEALSHQHEMAQKDLESLLGKKSIYPILKSLTQKGILLPKEELVIKYKPKKIKVITPTFSFDNDTMSGVLDQVKRADKQAEIILFLLQCHAQKFVPSTTDLEAKLPNSYAPLKALVKKGLVVIDEVIVSRHKDDNEYDLKDIVLTDVQQQAKERIDFLFESLRTVLIHGITGSGKTLIYLKLIEETIAAGGQVLYLVPEIALTTQLVQRIARYFGAQAGIYHSSMGVNHKVDLWLDVAKGKSIVIGPRSSLFLPFRNLSLIIIDEEHDYSFKQHDQSPKYHARETAIFLGEIMNSRVLLGSATPSLETYYNATSGKFGLVTLSERYGDAVLPDVHLVNRSHIEHNKMAGSHFSPVLINAILEQLKNKKQVIIFQNRRGYSTVLSCPMCSWIKKCKNCDVSMTYHKYFKTYNCHYCSWSSPPEVACPACGNIDLAEKGIGTEKIEEEIEILFPEATVARMDVDSIRSKSSLNELLFGLESRTIDILIGTQMVSKGLDFENIGLVAVVSADQLTRFPDFRAFERAFQLMVQVSGRSGRSAEKGQVYIQYEQLSENFLNLIKHVDYKTFYHQQVEERKAFNYPPFSRLLRIQIRHIDPQLTKSAADQLGNILKSKWGNRILGPTPGLIPRISNRYIFEILIKSEKSARTLSALKDYLQHAIISLRTDKKYRPVSFSIDVDPV